MQNIKVEYHANENQLKNSGKKIGYLFNNKKKKIHYHAGFFF